MNTKFKVIEVLRKLYPLPNVENIPGVSTTQLYNMLPECPKSSIRRVTSELVAKGQMTRISDGLFSPICYGILQACSWTPLEFDSVVNLVRDLEGEDREAKESRVAAELLKLQKEGSLSTLVLESKGPYPFYLTLYVSSNTLANHSYTVVHSIDQDP